MPNEIRETPSACLFCITNLAFGIWHYFPFPLPSLLMPPMPRWFRWIITHPFSVAAAIYLTANGIRFMLIKDFSEWDYVFVLGARGLLNGRNFYITLPIADSHAYTYPPLMSLLAVPFAWLWPGGEPHEIGRWIGRFLWYAINVVCALLLWRGCWKAASGGKIEGDAPDRQAQWTAIIGLLCGIRFIQDNFDHQQVDLLIGALLIGGVLAWQQGRELLSATWFGLGAAIKGPPLLLVFYLLWRGRWKAATWMVLVALAVNLLPDLVHRPPDGGLWLGHWYHQLVQPLSHVDTDQGAWQSANIFNQSIAGFYNRIVCDADGNRMVSATKLKTLIYGTDMVVALLVALALGRPLRRPADDSPTRRALECSAVLMAILLFSPMSSKPHFCVMLLPGMLLARRAVCDKDMLAAVALAVCIMSVDLLDRNILSVILGPSIGPRIGQWAMWYGSVSFGALVLGLGCMAAMRRHCPCTALDQSMPPRR